MMKNSIFLFLVLIFSFTIFSCSRVEKPEVVVSKFANHFMKGEYSEAKQYATASTIERIEIMESLASVGAYPPDEEDIELITDKDVECKLNGDSAVCSYLEYGEPVEILLLKIEKKWLIDFPLDEFMENEEWYEESEDEDNWEFDGKDSIITNPI